MQLSNKDVTCEKPLTVWRHVAWMFGWTGATGGYWRLSKPTPGLSWRSFQPEYLHLKQGAGVELFCDWLFQDQEGYSPQDLWGLLDLNKTEDGWLKSLYNFNYLYWRIDNYRRNSCKEIKMFTVTLSDRIMGHFYFLPWKNWFCFLDFLRNHFACVRVWDLFYQKSTFLGDANIY